MLRSMFYRQLVDNLFGILPHFPLYRWYFQNNATYIDDLVQIWSNTIANAL